MSRPGRWTRETFFAWAEAQEARYGFDGVAPVAMAGRTAGHSLIQGNSNAALPDRLRAPCRVFGPDAGLATVGDAVRYPDALVTRSPVDLSLRTIPGVVVVFEVLSPTSGRMDRIVKVQECASVPTIRRHVIVEHTGVGLTVLSRLGAGDDWAAQTLAEDRSLAIPEVGVEVPLAEIYAGVFDTPVA